MRERLSRPDLRVQKAQLLALKQRAAKALLCSWRFELSVQGEGCGLQPNLKAGKINVAQGELPPFPHQDTSWKPSQHQRATCDMMPPQPPLQGSCACKRQIYIYIYI